MLALLLGILKVILYIILFIVGLIIALILILLFVPIRYKVEGEKYDTIKLDVCVSWLLHLISFKYHMEEEPIISLKIFGKNVMGEKKEKKIKSKKKKKTKESKKKKIKKVRKVVENTDIKVQDHSHKEFKEIDKKDSFEEEKTISHETIKTETKKIIIDNDANMKREKEDIDLSKKEKEDIKKKPKKKNEKTKKSKTNETKDKSRKSSNKWKEIFSNIKDFLKNEENKAVLKMLKDKVVKMLKHILPHKFYSTIIVGTGDPASTGYVVGMASILYTFTGNKLKVTPNFQEQIFQGCFYGKGRIYLIVLLKNTLRIILDKRVRKLYKTYKA